MMTAEERTHSEWIGYIQPVGLVVSTPALVAAGVYVDRNVVPVQQRLASVLPRDSRGEPVPEIRDFPLFTRSVLEWEAADLDAELPPELSIFLRDYHETLRPTWAVRDPQPADPLRPWMILIQELAAGTPLDSLPAEAALWQATPQAKFERLLREAKIPIGILTNATHVRLVYAPRGESSGHATFPVKEMLTVAGRPILGALDMLLGGGRLFGGEPRRRLPQILVDSRKYQNVVSTKLAQQVLAALYELVRGFQAANDDSGGRLLRDVLAKDPNHVYAGLLTVLMRLVFLLFAEDRGLLSADPVYVNFYSVTGLFQRLRADYGQHPDTMDERFGAWAQLLTLFRLIHDGGRHAELRLPPRRGYLFDPERYVFLEGAGRWKMGDGEEAAMPRVSFASPSPTPHLPSPTSSLPRLPDGTVYRVLEKLLILDGERLSYRALDVEQIGSVYETMMGFNLEVARGRSIAIKPKKAHGAPTAINLDSLLAARPAERAKWLKAQTDQELSAKAAESLKTAATIEALMAALDRKIAVEATPHMVPPGAMVLQPSDERRKSGSHYTPRSLTEPIVRKTLEPILRRGDGSSEIGGGEEVEARASVKSAGSLSPVFGGEGRGEGGERGQAFLTSPTLKSPLPISQLPPPSPTPEQILALKVCDPAMGSGAFLVEACRQLGDALIAAWHAHNCVPVLPPDEDEVLHARRLIAQRCLYGVDRNPMAVDLSKLSLWLATLAKDHPFTFLDHALKAGDSLVGLTRQQIAAFHWSPTRQQHLLSQSLEKQIAAATEARRKIHAAGDDVPYESQQQAMEVAEEALNPIRRIGDLAVAAFFAADKPKPREAVRGDYLALVEKAQSREGRAEDLQQWLEILADLRSGPHPIAPFHWEIEFPEVFGRENPGFDAIVGNPPFAGRTTLYSSNHILYIDWLHTVHTDSHGNADLVAHFFRRSFDLLRQGGTLGLIATNTISQGDTRSTGLQWICAHGGDIYAAHRRYKWPGQAAVVVSIVHVARGTFVGVRVLDGRLAQRITAYLFHQGVNTAPNALRENQGRAFQGSVVVGIGFTFDDGSTGDATPISEMQRLLAENPANAQAILPYLGGEELNNNPTCSHRRYIINFGDLEEDVVRQKWPSLMHIVETKVKPDRVRRGKGGSVAKQKRAEKWWQFSAQAKVLYAALREKRRAIAISEISPRFAFAFVRPDIVFAHTLKVFACESFASFSVLQSRVHEVWARFFSSSMKDDLRYTPTDCFETFPFPQGALTQAEDCAARLDDGPMANADVIGSEYHEFRAEVMRGHDEGLTKTYNRFHDPHERSAEILKLRELHGAMDRAVLDAYGWTDLNPTCEFLLDYEEEDDDTEDDGSSKRRQRKKPWRYRWPDEFRDEVLARLLELNKLRAEQERIQGKADKPKKGRKKPSP